MSPARRSSKSRGARVGGEPTALESAEPAEPTGRAEREMIGSGPDQSSYAAADSGATSAEDSPAAPVAETASPAEPLEPDNPPGPPPNVTESL
ncbi:MAG: hypothetical protein ACXWM8_00005, partial [Candidatus Limnocylindrales bacterium]